MAHSHGSHGSGGSGGGHDHHGGHGLASTAAAVSAAAACTHTGRGVMSNFFKSPLVMLGIGAVAGFYAHKYRKEIIATATKYSEVGKDFVLQQKESLEDLVAETQEDGEEDTPREQS